MTKSLHLPSLTPPLLFGIALLCGSGCKSDSRISLKELFDLEDRVKYKRAELASHTEPLSLTEFQPAKLGPNDIIDIQLIGLADRTAQSLLRMRVRPDGTISLPIVGNIKVAGLTLGDAEAAIVNAYVPDISKELSAYIELSGPEKVTVIVVGAAVNRGLISLRKNERNILYAVAAAGGFGNQTNLIVHLRPINPDMPESVYDLSDVNDVRRALTAPPLESGDVITVQAASPSAVYTVGLVNLPGPIPIPPNSSLSILRAISAAGGLREYLSIKEGTLVRRLDDGRQVQVKLDIEDMVAGKAPDVDMKPGDILMVPQTLDTMAQEWARANLSVGPFRVGVNYDPLSQYNINRALNERSRGGGILDTIGSDLPLLFRPDLIPTAKVRP